jgi:hypothetical protein
MISVVTLIIHCDNTPSMLGDFSLLTASCPDPLGRDSVHNVFQMPAKPFRTTHFTKREITMPEVICLLLLSFWWVSTIVYNRVVSPGTCKEGGNMKNFRAPPHLCTRLHKATKNHLQFHPAVA